MKISEAQLELKEILDRQYDPRETKNIANIFWQDLFGHRGGIDRSLHTRELVVFREALEKLEKGMPIQYVTGVVHFYHTKLTVNSDVLIPRAETEELVLEVLNSNPPRNSRVLDIGTGSGCIAIALKNRRPDLQVMAIDKSHAAIKLAKINAEKNESNIRFQMLDFLSELAWENFGLFDIIVSNPPYISPSEKQMMSPSTLLFEPELALFPQHEDVLIFYRLIAKFSKEHLASGGSIFLECNEFNAEQVKEIFDELNFSKTTLVKDMQGKNRMLIAMSKK